MNAIIDDLEPFESSRMLIEKAEANIVQFESMCDTFVESCTYDALEKYDFQTKEKVITLKLKMRLSGNMRTAASAIVNDLRHALDQALCDGAQILGAPRISHIHFPFGKDKADWESEIKRRCHLINPDLVFFIRGFNSYYGGDSVLWAMGRIAGPNKHQRILHIALADQGTILHSEGLYCRSPFKLGINKWNDLRNELEFARVGEGGEIRLNFTIPLQVILGAVDTLSGSPAVAIFKELATKVKAIVTGIEAETSRLLTLRP